MDKRLHLGMDVGSVSLKTVLLDDEKNILFEDYTRLRGRPVETAIGVLRRMLGEFSPDEIASFSITGTGGERIGEALKGLSKTKRRKAIRYGKGLPQEKVNEACSKAVRHYLAR